MLFVSGEKPERFDKAVAAGADLVCIDLEDAVAPGRKAAARADALAWLATRKDDTPVALRINAVRTLAGLQDVLALATAEVMPAWLLLPKVEAAAELPCVQSWLGERCPALVALLETPGAIEDIAVIADTARAGGALRALMLGGADLSAELGCEFGWDGLLHARGRIVNAARAAGLQAWDVPHIGLQDLPGLDQETRRVLALGFDCKTAIHPSQIATIHQAFMPPADQLEWATALLADVDPAQAGAYLFRGAMVDAPVLRKARGIAARAGVR